MIILTSERRFESGLTVGTALHLGRFFVEKFRRQAEESGTVRAAANMRKQGVPLDLALHVLARRW